MFFDQNNIYANIIRFIHLYIIIFIIMTPFHSDIEMVRIHIFVILYILYGWIASKFDPSIDVDNKKRYGRCGLTELEAQLRGVEYKEGFLIDIVKPLKRYNQDNVDQILILCILLLFSISVYRYNYSE